ncbi:MAG: hypothetical protein JRJ19_07515 [Deltaproteobacteria bacterium]|nr:hypothetical protein [Deltaproteobacteria bacterium]MBW1871896.1 hypothetical protein [Deltaproteobacteria bacterium]
MVRYWSILLVLLAVVAAGCSYSLDVEGKLCDTDHACPTGFTCVAASDAGSVCIQGSQDGGLDGGDEGPCEDLETKCDDNDPLVVLICTEGNWLPQSCDAGEYCYFLTPLDDTVGCKDDCDTSADCERTEYYCNTTTFHCELKGDCDPPGPKQCLYVPDRLEKCIEESGLLEVEECELDEYCHDQPLECRAKCDLDADCDDIAGEYSCNPVNRKCLRMELCPDPVSCAAGARCEDGACVLEPTNECTSTQGDAQLQCFKDGAPVDSGVATTCQLEGYVVKLITPGNPRTGDTIGLTVEIFELSDILNGDDSSALASVTVTDNGGHGHYSIAADIPTKTDLVMVVRGGLSTNATNYATLYAYGAYLRADECDAGSGTLALDVPSLRQALFESYTEGTGYGVHQERGMLLARLLDCTDLDRLIGGTVGTSLEAQATFYIKIQDTIWLPDTEATTTQSPGFFGAVNMLPISGKVSALVRDSTGLVTLGNNWLRVFPNSVSAIIFKTPKKPN